MHHAPPAVEFLRFAEQDVFLAGTVEVFQGFYTAEPYDFDGGRAVREQTYQSHFCPFTLCCKRDKAAFDLHCRHFAR